jgi:hypothetical protein
MRIRSIKPAYWSDFDLHTRLTPAEREFYIGLWQQADDAGWLSWDVHRIGAELYPYTAVPERESFIEAASVHLTSLDCDAPHFVIFPCGHAIVPKMPSHQHLSGKPVYTTHAAHLKCPPRDHPRETAEARNGNGKEREVKGSNGMVAREDGLTPGDEEARRELRERWLTPKPKTATAVIQ